MHVIGTTGLEAEHHAAIDAAAREGKQLPGLHSPFWAPEADKVISAGAEALVVAAMDLMPRK